ncbi:MAG: RNA polymerase sigma factor [Cellulosilyticaceae bacterium]
MERLKRLYEDKAGLIYKYLLQRGATVEDAEEIVQSTFVKAIEYEVHLLNHSSAWLFKVALNQFYDVCRKQKRYPSIPLDEDMLYVELRSAGVEDVVMNQEVGERLKEQLGQMSATYHNLLILKYQMGLSYEAIGRLLGMKPETVKTYLYRARNEFKEKWRQRDER